MGANLGGRAMEAGFGLNKGALGFKGNQLQNIILGSKQGPIRTSQGPKGLQAEEHGAQSYIG